MKKKLSTLKLVALAIGTLFSVTGNAQFTAVQSGDWSNSATWGGTAPSSTVTNQNITIPSGITVTLDADVTFTGLLSTFSVNGVLTNTSTSGVFMTSGNLAGTGTVSVNELSFSLLATTNYAGSLNLKTLSNSAPALAFTSMANITDTLDLDNGTLSLNTNGNLTMANGATVKVNDGSISINSGVFNSGNSYNVMYVGTSKNSGVELNSVTTQNIYLKLSDNSQSVHIGNNVMVNGTLEMSSGKLDLNGKKLTLKGDLLLASGTMFSSNNTSDLEVQGTGSLTSAFVFTSGNSINDLTINRSGNGQVKLESDLAVAGHLYLMEGNMSIEGSGTLTANAASVIHVEKGSLSVNTGTFVGSASYNVEYMGSSDVTSGAELSGSGLNNVTVNYSSGTTKVTLNDHATINGKFQMTKGKMALNGKNLMINGTFDQSTSSWFTGNPGSELHLNMTSVTQDSIYFDNTDAASQTLSKLIVNTSGANAIVLGSKLIIGNELKFVNNKIELGNADLEITSTALITGYDDTKYVITSDNASGVLIQNVSSGSTYVTFPVGLSTDYSPVHVQQTASGTTGNFSVKCHTLYATSLKAVNRTWMVEGAAVTTINANIRFGWKASSEMNGFDRNNAYVSHYTSSMWDMTAATNATAGTYNTFELSRTGLTSLSPFAVVENAQPLKVAELSKLDGIEMYPNPSKDFINVKVLNPTDAYQYQLIDVTGRTVINTSNANALNKFDVSGLGSGCYFLKITNLSENKTTTKRFIKQ